MAVKTYKKSANKQLTKNLKLSEIHCHGKGCCNQTKFDSDLGKLFQKMRNVVGELNVESGYRCESHNKEVGGANGSGHTYGTALDVSSDKAKNKQLAILAELLGVPRIGIYDNSPNMVHIGTGNKCHWVNTGGYQPNSHSFIPVCYEKPKKYVDKNSDKKQIAYVQACLVARGYKIKIDGKWGNKTQNAVDKYRVSKGWQKANHLKTEGIKELLK